MGNAKDSFDHLVERFTEEYSHAKTELLRAEKKWFQAPTKSGEHEVAERRGWYRAMDRAISIIETQRNKMNEFSYEDERENDEI